MHNRSGAGPASRDARVGLPQAIRSRRLALGMSQRELAEACGYGSRSAVARLEAGEIDPPVSKLLAIAEALDTTPAALLAGGAGVSAAPDDPTGVPRGGAVAVVLAGGRSARTRSNVPAQFAAVLGKPVISYSLEVYQAHPMVGDIYVACLRGWEDVVESYARRAGVSKLRAVVPGGESGLLSIRNCVDRLLGDGRGPAELVVVQESNRPVVSGETVSALLASCAEHGSSVVCEVLRDHLVFDASADPPAYVDRRSAVSMQSPDAHRLGDLDRMFREADALGVPLNENCCGMLMHRLGWPVRFVDGGRGSVKIVRQEDLAAFEARVRRGA